jgi:hypothetical protein
MMTEPQYDGYMQTFSGRRAYPLLPDLNPFGINFNDIAHALSNVCRYAGHTKNFYSVAEHSLIMAKLFPNYKTIALLHDAAEAFLGDLPRPIKQAIPEFKKIENNLLNFIFKKAGIPVLNEESKEIIKFMDNVMLAFERKSPLIMYQENMITWGNDIDNINILDYTDTKEHIFNCYKPGESKDIWLLELSKCIKGE